MKRRTLARATAVKFLYMLDIRGEATVDLDEYLANASRVPEVADYARRIITGVREQREVIDTRLRAVAEHWTLERMAGVDRNILRVGVWELLMGGGEVPPAAVMDEAIALARLYGDAGSSAFVNGVLDKIAREGPAPADGG
ncbi:MAG: transcription antitermination factor NusB [Planctomycetota bacterium]